MDLYIEILAGDSKRRVFNWIHPEDCETEMSSGKTLRIHTHVALSCDLSHRFFFFSSWFVTPVSIWHSLSMLGRVKSDSYLQNKDRNFDELNFAVNKFQQKHLKKSILWKPFQHIYWLCFLFCFFVPECLPAAVCCLPSIQSGPDHGTYQHHTQPTAVQQYTHSQPTDSKLLLSFPTTPCLRSQPPAKQTVLEISLQITLCLPNPPGSGGNQNPGSPCPHRHKPEPSLAQKSCRLSSCFIILTIMFSFIRWIHVRRFRFPF